MSALPVYREIADVDGREPVGAVLTIGRKGERGSPIENDRFFFVSPFEAQGVRQPLPEFGRFNGAKPEARQVIHGNLVHAAIDEAWLHHLRAHKLPKPHPNHPARMPACTGDGRRATRFKGMDGDGRAIWQEIDCPNRQCEFRQGSPSPCKPMGRLYFRPSWSHYRDDSFHGLPTPLVKWTTGSWNTVANVVGFFDHVRAQATNLGLQSWSVYGLPFVLTLGRKTQPQHERAFPVVSISPLDDLINFFLFQRKQLEAAGGRLQLAVGNVTASETTPAALAADYSTITPGVPGDVVDVDEEKSEVTAVIEAIAALLDEQHPKREQREAALARCFGDRHWALVQCMPLDELTAGLAKLRAETAQKQTA